MTIRKIHHAAYRCVDAQQTIEWYGKYLGMHFMLAIAEDKVPSTGEPDPYMHVFLDASGGNILAFFELKLRWSPERYLIACQRYIALNPVRARVVAHPSEYPWSSYRINAEGEGNSLVDIECWRGIIRNPRLHVPLSPTATCRL